VAPYSCCTGALKVKTLSIYGHATATPSGVVPFLEAPHMKARLDSGSSGVGWLVELLVRSGKAGAHGPMVILTMAWCRGCY
jgi:hypothetical protein